MSEKTDVQDPMVAYAEEIGATENGTGLPCVISAWELTMEERAAIFETGLIWVRVLGNTHPPISLATECPFDEAE